MIKLGQGMIAVHRQHQRIGAQYAADQARVFQQLRRGGDVYAVLVQRFEYLLRIADVPPTPPHGAGVRERL